jgi:hypothetical protein
MATREITASSAGRFGFTTIAAAVAVIVGLSVTIVVAAMIAFSPAPSVGTNALSPHDDYYFRHQAAPALLGPSDDYHFRHPSAPTLGTRDDYALRHRAGGAGD